jgi:hypothetical protein
MTAKVNIVVNYDANKVEVFKAVEGNMRPCSEKEELFASQTMTMLQSLSLSGVDIEPVLDLGSSISFDENEDGEVCIAIVDNGRKQVIGGHHALSYRVASSVVKELKEQFPTYFEEYGYDDEDEEWYDEDDSLVF